MTTTGFGFHVDDKGKVVKKPQVLFLYLGVYNILFVLPSTPALYLFKQLSYVSIIDYAPMPCPADSGRTNREQC